MDYIVYTLYACGEEKAAKELGRKPESTVLGCVFKTSCLLSAFANEAMGHMTKLFLLKNINIKEEFDK